MAFYGIPLWIDFPQLWICPFNEYVCAIMRSLKRFPTGRELRDALLDRCENYCDLSGVGASRLSKQLTNNPAFLMWMRAGGNITLATYDKVTVRLARLERKSKAKPPVRAPSQPGDSP